MNQRLYMLDTNMISFVMRNNAQVIARLTKIPVTQVCISAVTKGELFFGLEKHHSLKLKAAIYRMLNYIDVLAWDEVVAEQYGKVRASMQNSGKTLAPLDMMIAAHALSVDAILVTNDAAFSQVENLVIEDWCINIT